MIQNPNAVELSELESAIADSVPNCDAFTSPQQAREMRDSVKRCMAGLRELQNYCEAKQHAMELRLAGNISAAARYESVCDAIYQRMPELVKTW